MTWRLLYVRPLAEKKVLAALAELKPAPDAYVPKERVWRGIGPRRKPTERPLLPSIVFADLPDDDDLLTFIRHELEGVAAVVTPRLRTTPVRQKNAAPTVEDFVLQLRFAETEGLYDKTKSKKVRLKVGDRVRIVGGPMAGFAATIIGMNSARRAKLIGDVFGRPARINAVEADLELEEDEAEPPNTPVGQKFAA